MNKRFMPQSISKRWLLKERHSSLELNYQSRVEWYPAGWTNHKKQFAKRFSRLHHLACHSPDPVAIKWKHTYNNFMNKHFGEAGKSSTRFTNNHTCHKWL